MSDEPTDKTCFNCSWWYRFDESQLTGYCVWHNGVKKTPAAKLQFSGVWKEDHREREVAE